METGELKKRRRTKENEFYRIGGNEKISKWVFRI